jgi:hypothetical protein
MKGDFLRSRLLAMMELGHDSDPSLTPQSLALSSARPHSVWAGWFVNSP